jgi:hypothetical protein
MTLRHAYTLHSLEAGMNIRLLEEALGHLPVETTLRPGWEWNLAGVSAYKTEQTFFIP